MVVDGRTILPNMVLGNKRKGLKICYCTDTRPTKEIENFAQKSDLFICEGMYMEKSYLLQAKKHKHMLGTEAADVAKRSNVKELWLTHFSPAIPNSYLCVSEPKEIFENTKLGYDRMNLTLDFEKE